MNYRAVNLLPGFHVSTTKKLAPHSFVPIFTCGDKVIHGSNKIITFLDKEHPEQSLTPEGKHLGEALEWEKYADEELGLHVRRCCYHIFLEYPDIVINFFAHQGLFYGKPLLKLIFPKLKNEDEGVNEDK